MLGLCFAPIVLAGFVMGIHNPYKDGHIAHLDSPMAEVLTCNQGLGAHATLAPHTGLYSAGLQYSLEFPIVAGVKGRLIPMVGISHDTRHYRELPLHTQFEVGGEVHLAYGEYTLALKYWHLSNAGLRDKNLGLDMGALLVGYSY